MEETLSHTISDAHFSILRSSLTIQQNLQDGTEFTSRNGGFGWKITGRGGSEGRKLRGVYPILDRQVHNPSKLRAKFGSNCSSSVWRVEWQTDRKTDIQTRNRWRERDRPCEFGTTLLHRIYLFIIFCRWLKPEKTGYTRNIIAFSFLVACSLSCNHPWTMEKTVEKRTSEMLIFFFFPGSVTVLEI